MQIFSPKVKMVRKQETTIADRGKAFGSAASEVFKREQYLNNLGWKKRKK